MESEKKRHEVKAWPRNFESLAAGRAFTIRRNDRGYQAGDLLLVVEFDPTPGALQSGRRLLFQITDVIGRLTPETEFAAEELLAAGAVVIGLKRLRFGEAV